MFSTMFLSYLDEYGEIYMPNTGPSETIKLSTTPQE